MIEWWRCRGMNDGLTIERLSIRLSDLHGFVHRGPPWRTTPLITGLSNVTSDLFCFLLAPDREARDEK